MFFRRSCGAQEENLLIVGIAGGSQAPLWAPLWWGRAGDTEAGTGTQSVDWAEKSRGLSMASFVLLLVSRQTVLVRIRKQAAN